MSCYTDSFAGLRSLNGWMDGLKEGELDAKRDGLMDEGIVFGNEGIN